MIVVTRHLGLIRLQCKVGHLSNPCLLRFRFNFSLAPIVLEVCSEQPTNVKWVISQNLDVASLAAVQLDITADQFNTEKRHHLDTHAPSTQRQVTRCHRSP